MNPQHLLGLALSLKAGHTVRHTFGRWPIPVFILRSFGALLQGLFHGMWGPSPASTIIVSSRVSCSLPG